MQKYVKYALRVKLMLCLNSVLITFKLQTMADQIPGSLCSIKLSPFTFSWDFIFSNRIRELKAIPNKNSMRKTV